MTQFHPSSCPPSIRGLFAAALVRVLCVWILLVLVSSAFLAVVAIDWLGASLAIAGFSGLISVFSLIPGMSMTSAPSKAATRESKSTRSLQFLVASMAAMAIRFAGTVALLVACRYQLGLPLQTMAFLVGGWYIVLTSVEIIWLAKGASTLDSESMESGLCFASQETLADGTES